MLHKDIVGDEAVHPAAFKDSADPGAVGAGKFWIDTTTGPPYILKVRDATDTGWEVVGSIATEIGGEDIDLTGAANGQVLMRVGGVWVPVNLTGADIDAGSIDIDRIDATGSPSVTTFLRGDGSWATPAGGSGSAFPDDVGTFGTTHADDEEWENDLSAWTSIAALTGPANDYEINGTFTPSRLRVRLTSTTGSTMTIVKAMASGSGDQSVTFDAAGVFAHNFRNIAVGFVSSATMAGAAAMLAVLHHSTVPQLIRRKYSNVGTGASTDQATISLAGSNEPRKFFLHLQRVSNVWSMWFSIDGVSWDRVQGTTTDSFAISHIYVSIDGGGGSSDPPCYLANNWIRFNRFLLG